MCAAEILGWQCAALSVVIGFARNDEFIVPSFLLSRTRRADSSGLTALHLACVLSRRESAAAKREFDRSQHPTCKQVRHFRRYDKKHDLAKKGESTGLLATET